jgi:hypothetical protein
MTEALAFKRLARSLGIIATFTIVGPIVVTTVVYCGMNSLWAALVIVGIMVIGVVALSLFVSPSESSPLVLPSVDGLRQGAFLALFLSIPAAIAASLCWLLSRPLHRLS